MGLDIYFPEDISRILAALSQANARNGADAYQAALDDVAAAFGLDMITITEVRNEQQIDDETGHDRVLSATFSYH